MGGPPPPPPSCSDARLLCPPSYTPRPVFADDLCALIGHNPPSSTAIQRERAGREHGDGIGEQEAAHEGDDRRRTAQGRQRRQCTAMHVCAALGALCTTCHVLRHVSRVMTCATCHVVCCTIRHHSLLLPGHYFAAAASSCHCLQAETQIEQNKAEEGLGR